MHKSAMTRMKWFVDNYIPKDKKVKVLDIGSYSVNGNYKILFNGTQVQYTGMDINRGPNVDLVVSDPYDWKEIEDESYDYMISGNAFEHIEYPWLTIEQMYKKLKPDGFICILTPFAHVEHRYPVDCYRYFSDGLKALAKWGKFKVIECTVGGVPKGTQDPKWLSKDENYDDTMLVAAKTDDTEKLKTMPKLNATMLTREWKIR